MCWLPLYLRLALLALEAFRIFFAWRGCTHLFDPPVPASASFYQWWVQVRLHHMMYDAMQKHPGPISTVHDLHSLLTLCVLYLRHGVFWLVLCSEVGMWLLYTFVRHCKVGPLEETQLWAFPTTNIFSESLLPSLFSKLDPLNLLFFADAQQDALEVTMMKWDSIDWANVMSLDVSTLRLDGWVVPW